MIRTSSVIKDGALVKSHTDYPVTNKTWKLMGIELSVYLDSLNLTDPTNSIFENYNDIWNWYLRSPHRNESNLDPWNRLFVCYDGEWYEGILCGYNIVILCVTIVSDS
jgi:hypothetical protein